MAGCRCAHPCRPGGTTARSSVTPVAAAPRGGPGRWRRPRPGGGGGGPGPCPPASCGCGGLDLVQQVEDPHARPRRLVGAAPAGQVVRQLRRVQREVPGEVRVLEIPRPPRVPGGPRPVAQGGPAPRLEPLQLGLAVEAHPLGVGVRGAPFEEGRRADQRLLAADAVRQPRPAARLAQREQGHQPGRAQRAGGALRGLGRPDRLARAAGVAGQERHVAEGVRLQAGVAVHPGGGQGLGVVGAGVVEAPRVVRQPADGDRQFTGARVEPVRGGLPGRAGVQERVRGAQRGRRAPVEGAAAPVVEHPDPADGFFEGTGLARPGPARGRPAAAASKASVRGPSEAAATVAPLVMNARRSTSLSSLSSCVSYRSCVSCVSRVSWVSYGSPAPCGSLVVRAWRPRTDERGANPRSVSVRPGNMCRNTRSYA
ncbi:hypothetical protein STENM327S_07540 [Streptomyces tendae]